MMFSNREMTNFNFKKYLKTVYMIVQRVRKMGRKLKSGNTGLLSNTKGRTLAKGYSGGMKKQRGIGMSLPEMD